MAEKTSVHGFSVMYEKDAYAGVDYLQHDLDYEEARVFFDQARMRGHIKLEDDDDRQFTLTYKSGIYTLARR